MWLVRAIKNVIIRLRETTGDVCMEELKLILNNLNQHKLIEVDELVRADFVRKYCQQNACGKYGRTWVCFEANKKKYKLDRAFDYDYVLLFNNVYKLEDSFDIETMDSSAAHFMDIVRKIWAFFKKKKLDSLPFGLGGCELCKKCTFPNDECRYPDQVIFPLESIDIDVASTAYNNGFNYINGINTVTYFAIFFLKGERIDV